MIVNQKKYIKILEKELFKVQNLIKKNNKNKSA
jgi:hypothetical protein